MWVSTSNPFSTNYSSVGVEEPSELEDFSQLLRFMTLQSRLHPFLVENKKLHETVTYCDVAVRLDLVDPETLLQHSSCPVQQLLEMQQGKGSDLKKNNR